MSLLTSYLKPVDEVVSDKRVEDFTKPTSVSQWVQKEVPPPTVRDFSLFKEFSNAFGESALLTAQEPIELAGNLGFDSFRRLSQKLHTSAEDLFGETLAPEDFVDAKTVEDYGRYFIKGLGHVTGFVAGAAVPALLTRTPIGVIAVAANRALALRGLKKAGISLTSKAGEEAIAVAQKNAHKIADKLVGLNVFATPNFNAALAQQRAAGLDANIPAALATAAAQTAVDVIVPGKLLRKSKKAADKTLTTLREDFVQKVLEKTLAKDVAKVGTVGGGIGGLHVAIGEAAQAFLDENKDFLSEETWKHITDGIAEGTIAGTVLGGAAETYIRHQKVRADRFRREMESPGKAITQQIREHGGSTFLREAGLIPEEFVADSKNHPEALIKAYNEFARDPSEFAKVYGRETADFYASMAKSSNLLPFMPEEVRGYIAARGKKVTDKLQLSTVVDKVITKRTRRLQQIFTKLESNRQTAFKQLARAVGLDPAGVDLADVTGRSVLSHPKTKAWLRGVRYTKVRTDLVRFDEEGVQQPASNPENQLLPGRGLTYLQPAPDGRVMLRDFDGEIEVSADGKLILQPTDIGRVTDRSLSEPKPTTERRLAMLAQRIAKALNLPEQKLTVRALVSGVSTFSNRQGGGEIHITEQSPMGMMLAMGHELGHSLFAWLAKQPRSLLASVYQGYQKVALTTTDLKYFERVADLESVARTAADPYSGLVDMESHANYLRDFNEWFAESVSKLLLLDDALPTEKGEVVDDVTLHTFLDRPANQIDILITLRRSLDYSTMETLAPHITVEAQSARNTLRSTLEYYEGVLIDERAKAVDAGNGPEILKYTEAIRDIKTLRQTAEAQGREYQVLAEAAKEVKRMIENFPDTLPDDVKKVVIRTIKNRTRVDASLRRLFDQLRRKQLQEFPKQLAELRALARKTGFTTFEAFGVLRTLEDFGGDTKNLRIMAKQFPILRQVLKLPPVAGSKKIDPYAMHVLLQDVTEPASVWFAPHAERGAAKGIAQLGTILLGSHKIADVAHDKTGVFRVKLTEDFWREDAYAALDSYVRQRLGAEEYVVDGTTRRIPDTVVPNSLLVKDAPLLNKSLGVELVKFNKFLKLAADIRAWSILNPDLEPLQKYVQRARLVEATKNEVYKRSRDIDAKLRALNKQEQADLMDILATETTTNEFASIRELDNGNVLFEVIGLRYELTKEAADTYFSIRDSFRLALSDIYGELINRAQERGQDTTELQAELAALMEKPYMHLHRYGKYGIGFKLPGHPKQYEMYETKRQFERRLAQLRKFKKIDIYATEKADQNTIYTSLPPELLRRLVQDNVLDLTPGQLQQIQHILEANLPDRSLRNTFKRQKGTLGFSTDIRRVLATYHTAAGNYLARLRHGEPMQQHIADLLQLPKEAKERVPEGTIVVSRKTTQIAEGLQKHLNDLFNPQGEWLGLRAFWTTYYLGVNPKNILLNLMQIPLIVYPTLSMRLGPLVAARHLLPATAKETARALARAPQTLGKVLPKRIQRKVDEYVAEHIRWAYDYLEGKFEGPGRTPEETRKRIELSRVIRRAELEGMIDQSYATETAAVADSDFQQRVMQSTLRGAGLRAARALLMPFQASETITRRASLIAGFKAAREAGMSFEDAYAFARNLLDDTVYDYTRALRPAMQRGVLSNFTLFWTWTTKTLQLVSGLYGRAEAEAVVATMLIATGLMGVPLAQDLVSFLSAATRLATGKYVDIERAFKIMLAEEFGERNANAILHGWVATGFGLPALDIDISGSLSIGRAIPGAEELTSPRAGTVERTAIALGGAGMGMMVSTYQALTSDSPSVLWRLRKAAPSAVKFWIKALEMKETGGIEDRSGDLIVAEPATGNKIWLQALGLNPRALSEYYERTHTDGNIKAYWAARQQAVLNRVYYAIRRGDAAAWERAMTAVQRFNNSVRFPALKITRQTVRQSMKARINRYGKKSLGIPSSRKLFEATMSYRLPSQQ